MIPNNLSLFYVKLYVKVVRVLYLTVIFPVLVRTSTRRRERRALKRAWSEERAVLEVNTKQQFLFSVEQEIMPWQTAPPLIIIAGAFNVAAGLMWGAQAITGEVRSYFYLFERLRSHNLTISLLSKEKSIQQDEWTFAMKNRDKRISEYEDLLRKASKPE